MPSVVLYPTSGPVSFTYDPGTLAGGEIKIQTYRDYELDGTDLPTGIVVESVTVFVSGQHQFLVIPDSAPSKSVQRRWITAGAEADSDWPQADWPENTSNPSDTFAAPSAGVCTGLSFPTTSGPGDVPWTRSGVLGARYGFDLAWHNVTANPHQGRPSRVCDFYVTVAYHLGDEEGSPPPEETPAATPPTVPCCCSCPEDPTPSGPTPTGSVTPPDGPVEHFPQCNGGGEMPVYEALLDSELYL